jgi:DNA polymerase/3'-5' exonuclease PolX
MPPKQRHTLTVAHRVADALREGMPTSNWYLMGSYRRLMTLQGTAARRVSVGDLDVLVVRRDNSLRDFHFPPVFTADLASGKRLARGHVTVGRTRMRADFWVCTPRHVGGFLLYGTGPQNLAIHMRAVAKARGWKLNQTGLWDASNRQLDDGTEEHIFQLLGMKYLTPWERDSWSGPNPDTATEVLVASGRPGHKAHRVLLDGAKASCDCEDFLYRHNANCKHVQQARNQMAAV